MPAPVTVAVVSWNTRALLARCLQSMQPDVSSGLAEVWVVDNASADGSAQLVSDRFGWAHLIASTENLGFGAAVNAVAARTASPWLVPANADIALTPGALRSLVAEGERHPEAAVIAPRLVLPDGSTQHSVYPFPTIPFTLAHVLRLTDHSALLARHWCVDGGFDPAVGREVSWAVGAFQLVRRRAFDEVGGFSAEQWMYAEDLDLGWRLHRAGWSARYAPEAVVLHEESAATRSAWGEERHRRWHVATYQWMARRRGAAVARTVAAINVAAQLARAAWQSPGALLGREQAVAARYSALVTARNHAVGLRVKRLLGERSASVRAR
jgi:N-acetylglucosaminyl-diphospho-decaprenol L-rhamnosyltransferase